MSAVVADCLLRESSCTRHDETRTYYIIAISPLQVYDYDNSLYLQTKTTRETKYEFSGFRKRFLIKNPRYLRE